MSDASKASAPNGSDVEKKISYIGARLREKSTYAGLLVVVGFALPYLSKYVPVLASANAADIVSALSSIGIGIGGLIAIVVPEKSAAKAIVALLAIGAVLAIGVPARAMAQPPDRAAFAAAIKQKPQRVQIAQASTASRPVLPNIFSAAPSTATQSAPTNIADAIQSVLTQLQNLDETVIPKVVAALQAADADAATVVTPPIPAQPATATSPATAAVAAVVNDPIAHACYPALVQYLQSLPVANINTSITPPYDAIVLFQYKRDFVNLLLRGQLIPTYLQLGCAPLLGNEAQVLAAALGLVGVGASVLNPITAFGTSLGAAAVTLLPKL